MTKNGIILFELEIINADTAVVTFLNKYLEQKYGVFNNLIANAVGKSFGISNIVIQTLIPETVPNVSNSTDVCTTSITPPTSHSIGC